jgi:uncharacterized membrane protein required for colicin V production
LNILDYIIIGILILSTLVGFKKGFINSVVAFAGTLLIIILAFYLKNPISAFLYGHLPFLSLSGKFEGVGIVSILIYEGISYLITLIILSFIMGIIIKISGIFNKIVHATLILTLPSKILGAICGLIEGVILAFIIVFIIGLVSPSTSAESKYASSLLTKTPILSIFGENTQNSLNEIYEICTNYENTTDKTKANLESLDVLLKYEILSTSSAENLVANDKLNIDGASEIIEKYKKGL